MIVNFISDVHLESGKLSYEVPPEAEVVVIAGDLWNGNSGLLWLEEFANQLKIPVVYVPGNHCFWDNNLHTWPAAARKFCRDIGVYFLYNDVVEIKDTVILGTTLWTDFNLHGNQPLKLVQATGMMSDYLYINGKTGDVTPEEISAEHHQARSFLDSTLAQHVGRKRLVVTHHAPSRRSLPDQFNKYAPFYASNMEAMIMAHQPDLWIHGHIHKSVQYFIGETMVVTNPRGHANQPEPHRNVDFNAPLLVEF